MLFSAADNSRINDQNVVSLDSKWLNKQTLLTGFELML